jgi:hypothetical protein
MIIMKLVSENGIDPRQFNIDIGSIESIRYALGHASDEELKKVAEQFEENRKGRK